MKINNESLFYDRVQDDILSSLKDVINNEEADALTYEALITIAQTDEEKLLLRNIYNDELKHYRILQEISLNYENQIISNSQLPKSQYSELGYIKTLKNAKLDELEAVKKYQQIYSKITDNHFKNMIFEIITDELIHAHLIDYILLLNTNKKTSIRVINNKKTFSIEEAKYIADKLEIDFSKELFDLEQFRMGLDVELEHGKINPKTNVTNDDYIMTGKIALAHLYEIPDYYNRLLKMEQEAILYWKNKMKS